ncbi:hypothetical protein [Rhizobium sp. 007]|uniref:hypothetical protein n=1 Tax=Rhizobium sp. 007 TaxID=2785056 RepID=UPI00188E27EE|nr:hypothetical protein [Rhizobium sp. 007]QPB21160.1 hypothetical protein ISN39_06780 [Rhizobium sp. 007]
MSDEDRVGRLEGASIEAAQEGLKALLILNGGACIALLGFVATTISQPEASATYRPLIRGMMKSLVSFSVGAGLSVLTSMFAYLTNQAYVAALEGPDKYSWAAGQWWNNVAVMTALLSLVAFFVGVSLIWQSAPA